MLNYEIIGALSAISFYTYSTYGRYMVTNLSKVAEKSKRDILLAIITTVILLFVYMEIAMVGAGILLFHKKLENR